jgi:hypothetical protein
MITDAIRPIKRNNLTWDDDNKLYRYPNGRVVSDRGISLLINRELGDMKSNQQWSLGELNNGQMTFEEFQQFNIKQIKEYHVNMMRLGRGGKDKTAANDYLTVARELKSTQYPAFERFMERIKAGELSEAQIKDRLSKYANSAKVSYERGKLTSKGEIGRNWGRRRLGNCKNHCSPCIYYASLGWQPLPSVVPPGVRCDCGSYCCCSVETSENAPVNLSDRLLV